MHATREEFVAAVRQHPDAEPHVTEGWKVSAIQWVSNGKAIAGAIYYAPIAPGDSAAAYYYVEEQA